MTHDEHDKHGKKCRYIDVDHRIKYVCNKQRRGWLVQRKYPMVMNRRDNHRDPWVSISARAQSYEDAIIRLCALAGARTDTKPYVS